MSDIVVVLSPPLTTDQANSEEFEVGRIDYRIMGELTGVFVWAAFRVHASTVFFFIGHMRQCRMEEFYKTHIYAMQLIKLLPYLRFIAFFT